MGMIFYLEEILWGLKLVLNAWEQLFQLSTKVVKLRLFTIKRNWSLKCQLGLLSRYNHSRNPEDIIQPKTLNLSEILNHSVGQSKGNRHLQKSFLKFQEIQGLLKDSKILRKNNSKIPRKKKINAVYLTCSF